MHVLCCSRVSTWLITEPARQLRPYLPAGELQLGFCKLRLRGLCEILAVERRPLSSRSAAACCFFTLPHDSFGLEQLTDLRPYQTKTLIILSVQFRFSRLWAIADTAFQDFESGTFAPGFRVCDIDFSLGARVASTIWSLSPVAEIAFSVCLHEQGHIPYSSSRSKTAVSKSLFSVVGQQVEEAKLLDPAFVDKTVATTLFGGHSRLL